jgi:hypothetical protein
VKSGRRPPRPKASRKPPATAPQGGEERARGEMPFSTHVGLPVLQPGGEQAVEVDPGEMLDAEDLPPDTPVTASSTDLPPRSKMRGERGVQGTHVSPPADAQG